MLPSPKGKGLNIKYFQLALKSTTVKINNFIRSVNAWSKLKLLPKGYQRNKEIFFSVDNGFVTNVTWVYSLDVKQVMTQP